MFKHEIVTVNDDLPYWVYVNKGNISQITKHWHSALEIDFTVHGQADYIVSGKRTQITDNEFILINSQEIHSVENIKNILDRRSLVLLIPYENIVALYPKFENLQFTNKGRKDAKEKLSGLLKKFYDTSFIKDKELRNLQQLGYYYLIVYAVLESFCETKSLPIKKGKEEKVKEIVKYLSQHYSEDISLNEIAIKNNISPGYLARLFNEEMGVSVIKYLQMIRLQNGFNLLTNTDKSITAISDEIGFANVKSFRKLFKEFYKQTPTNYKKSLRGE